MGLRILSTTEVLVRDTRKMGPFGGLSLDSVSVSGCAKKGEALAQGLAEGWRQKGGLKSLEKTIRVWLEDKYDKSRKVLVEEWRVRVLEAPTSMNGFEYLCHPSLEKEENLVKYMQNWHLLALSSSLGIVQNSNLNAFYINPVTQEEKEVSNELRKKFNLIVDSDTDYIAPKKPGNESEAKESRKEPKALEKVLKCGHFFRKLRVELKVKMMPSFKETLEDIRREAINTQARKRNRFFSDEIPENQIQTRRHNYSKMLPDNYDRQNSGDDSFFNNSSDVSTSMKSSSRPFKVQDSMLEEKAKMSKRRVSIGNEQSFSNHSRKGTLSIIEESICTKSPMEYILTEINEAPAFPKKNSSSMTKLPHLESFDEKESEIQKDGGPKGLASIGTEMLRNGRMKLDDLELDEDDRLIEMSNILECLEMQLEQFPKNKSIEEKPVVGSKDSSTKVVFNLIETNSRPIDSYLNLGEWIEAQKKG